MKKDEEDEFFKFDRINENGIMTVNPELELLCRKSEFESFKCKEA